MESLLFVDLSGALSASRGGLWLPLVLIAVPAYFLGCFNGSVIISKYILKDDIRTHGSGNAGLTNFYRTFGGRLTLAVILMDMLKAVFAVLIGMAVARHFFSASGAEGTIVLALGKYWGGMFCLFGHMFPCMFHFRGGKGILSGGAMTLLIDWRVALVVWGSFFILAVLTRYVSLGSVCAAAGYPIVSWCVFQNVQILILALVTGGMVIWRHRSNIGRLIHGTESKFTVRHKTEGKQ
jgi:glycerol-3-phosphate acyltransferase PlsY